MENVHVSHVTEAEINEILAQAEAGVGTLMAAYEPVEQAYFDAVNSAAPSTWSTTYSTSTTSTS